MKRFAASALACAVVLLTGCPGSASFGSSELRVWFGETEIVTGGVHNFGGIAAGTSGTTQFTVRNSGVRNLEISGGVSITGAQEFTVETQPAVSVAPGEESFFAVSFSPAAVTAALSAVIAIESNVSYLTEAFSFTVQGQGAVVPDTLRPTVTITSSLAGPTTTSPIPLTVTFSEEVTGFETADLNVNFGSVSPVTSTDNIVFTSAVTPSGDQVTVTVDIAENSVVDASGNGNVEALQFSIIYDTTLAPEIAVLQDTTSISVGGEYPFGAVAEGGTSGSVAFTIENSGTAGLTFTGDPLVAIIGTDPGEFSVDVQPAVSSIGLDVSASFSISFNPTGIGDKTATVSIANDDADENPYTFTVSGTGSGDINLLPFDFTATYLRIIDQEHDGVNLYNCKVDMSNDGSILGGYTYDSQPYYAYSTDYLGANVQLWSMGAVDGDPNAVAVSGDGTHIYVASDHDNDTDPRYPVLFRIVGDVFTQLNITEAIAEGIPDIRAIDCTGDGSTIYINDDDEHHVWTCGSDGTGFTELIDPSLFTRFADSVGLWINELAVNDAGDRIAFTMSRWSPLDDQDEIFAWDSTNGFQRLTTDDDPERGKSSLGISLDGTKILFRATASDPDPSWYISELAGTPTAVPGVPLNGEGAGNGDMSLIFRSNPTFSDSGGSLTTVSTGKTRQLFAGLGIDADGGLNINGTGDLIGFTHTYKSSPSVRALYTGLIGSMDGENGAPVIEWIRVSPPTISKADTGAELIVTVKISDSGGLGDIHDIDRDILDDGDFFPSGEEPLSVSPLYDGGNAPDITAGDGIYSATCTATTDMPDFSGSSVTIRVGVEDADGNAVVADVSVAVTP